MSNRWPDRLGVWWIAEDHPELVAIASSPSGSLTFAELIGRAHQVVHALRANGVGDGSTVAVLMPNDVDLVIWSLACQEGGWYFLPLNPHLTSAEIEVILQHSGAALYVADERCGAARSRPAIATLECWSIGTIPGFSPVARRVDNFSTSKPLDRRPGGFFVYTSGTTGAPKGIRRPRPTGDPSAAANTASVFARAFDFDTLGGCHLVAAAMHHTGTHSFYMAALNAGESLVIMSKFDAEACLQAIQDFRVTTAYMVPTMFHRLLQLPDTTRAAFDISSLHSVVHSAAACPRPVKEAMFDWWGPVIWETYGGSESPATIAKPHRWLEHPGTVGRSIRGVEISVLDNAGHEVQPGKLGLVYIECETTPFQYHGDEAATRDAFVGRRFTLGDIGYVDSDGYLFIKDRQKDMIISGGVNIFPAESEAVLLMHPAVGDVAVIGIPDGEWGETVKAIVVPTPGHLAGPELEATLVAFCREQLAHFKCPRSVDFRTALPRTEAGKLYKRELRNEYEKPRTRERTVVTTDFAPAPNQMTREEGQR